MSNQENIKKLSELRQYALPLITQYNEIAEAENYETRIGIIDASYDTYDVKYRMAEEIIEGGDEPSKELIDSMIVDVKSLMNNNNPYWQTDFPGVQGYAWRPSGLNC
jgi:hypothetical protein